MVIFVSICNGDGDGNSGNNGDTGDGNINDYANNSS